MKLFIKNIFVLVITLFAVSCVKEPSGSDAKSLLTGSGGVYILCEGLMGQNNSSLARIDPITFNYNADNFLAANKTPLGDVANSITIHNDKAYIAVSGTAVIRCIDLNTTKLIATLYLSGRRSPRQIAFLNDSSAWFSDLYDNSICEFNPVSMKETGKRISTGPAPEGLAIWSNLAFVANSALGDYMAKEPKAGTVSVIDIKTGSDIKSLQLFPDPVELKLSRRNSKLYLAYYHLPSLPDSLGGIVEFSLPGFNITRHIRCHPKSLTLNQSEDTLYYIENQSVMRLDLRKDNSLPEVLMTNPNKLEYYYSLAVSPIDNSLWIANAKNYLVNGEILIYKYNEYNVLSGAFRVGVNPNTILFFGY